MRLAVALMLLAGVATAEETPYPRLRCEGAEPNWQILLDGKTATLKDFDSPDRHFGILRRQTPGNRATGWTDWYDLKDGQETAALVIHRTDACSDGASDEDQPFEALYHGIFQGRKDRLIQGCCVVPDGKATD